MLWTFFPVAIVVSVTPGPAFALVVRSAVRSGPRAAVATILGNAVGIGIWALLSRLGISAVVAASQVAYDVLRIAGAATLVVIGIRTWRGAGSGDADEPRGGSSLRLGLLTSLANPKLAVFFVALFPQFVPGGVPVLPATLAMAGLLVACDLVWYSAVAWGVARVRDSVRERIARRLERLSGGVLVALGVRLALERTP